MPIKKKKPRFLSERKGKFSRKKTLFFKLIAILSPFVFLLVLELFLRLFHYGNNFDLFITAETDDNLLVLNPAVSRKYFVNEELAPSGNREFFKKKKDEHTIRLFVLGESTTIGYPYFHNGSFSRWLSYRLMYTYPDQQFEIINLSLTAVNSYTVLDFAKEIIHYEPDGVLIYSGQNEYYGALGVGSTMRLGSNRFLIELMLTLRKSRVFQLFSNLHEKIMHSSGFSKNRSGGTLMQMMVADQNIPYQSALYDKGIRQFRANLNETLNLLDSYHIPIFVSTLVSNEKDLKPFINIPADSLKVPEFRKNFESGLKALAIRDTAHAIICLKKANDLFDRDALCNFYLGQIAYANRDYAEAGNFFVKASDLDGLRFRAPSEFNQIIRGLCKKYTFAHLVDTRAAFENNSAFHIIGNELMLEHVHPNLKGYAIMSDVFYHAIDSTHLVHAEKQTEMSLDQLESQMPVTIMDSLSGIYRIAKLKKSWPFQEITMNDSVNMQSREQQLAHELVFGQLVWVGAIDSLYNYYLAKNNLAGAATVMQTLVLEHPQEISLYIKTAMLFGKMNDLFNASLYFKRSFAIAPSVELARYLFVIYFKLDDPSHAIPYLDYCIKNSAQAAVLVAIKSYGKEIIELKKKYVPGSSDPTISHQIVNLYLKMGNKEAAEKYGLIK